MDAPKTFRAWQFNSATGGMEKNLRLNTSTPLPQCKPNQHLVQVLAAAVNPVDHKPVEIPFFTKFMLKTPATPGLDFAGRIIQPADGSLFQPGQLVFGTAGDGGFTGGAFGEYTIALDKRVAALPDGLSPIAGASIPIAGVTAYQALVPYLKPGNSVFINGGSGGTGVFAIQVAKAVGAHVTTTCSAPNIELCKSLGADEVIDYRQSNVLQALVTSGRKYDHVVDNIGSNHDLYWKAHLYTRPGAVVVNVGGPMTFWQIYNTIAKLVWPTVLGGGQRKLNMLLADLNPKDLTHVANWMRDGQIKPVIDSQYAFEDAPKAYEKLKTGRARGKIVVDVSGDAAAVEI